MRRLGARSASELGAVGARKQLMGEAKAFAKAEVRRVERGMAAALARMPRKHRKHFLRKTYHDKQVRYFELVEAEGDALIKGGARGRLRDAAQLAVDAAKVKPVAGRLPIHHAFAGEEFPVSRLSRIRHRKAIAAIRRKGRTGVPFTEEGYPDFEPWMYRKGPVKGKVEIKYTGDKARKDFELADNAMRWALRDPRWRRPDGWTWHHHEDMTTMILVPADLHEAVRHTGGVAHFRMFTGEYDAY